MTKYEKHGVLHVNAKGKLVDHNGEEVALYGFSSHGLSWYPQYINRDFFEFMSEKWHVDVIRLAMYTDEENGYCVGDEENRAGLLDLIDRGVKAATEVGLYVIIDWHILRDSNPLIYSDMAAEFFDIVAERYHAYGNVIYEICNEPNVNCTWKDIKTYAEEIIPIIRKHTKYAPIFVGTPTWSQDVDEAAKDPITIDKNLMYVFHFYADTHRDELRAKFKAAAENGLPLIITEFGCCDASGAGDNNFEQSDMWIRLADNYNVGYIMWNISNRDETSASFKPDCDKTTGFEEEDLSEACKWFLKVLEDHREKKQS
ncbi:MAG: glycoside hydrolase family 5 protein [Lachnospiraceae bacterium]|nr:glycoside hydrolase family 5 protein [Lachnospiraceae bacterium]